MMTLGNRDRKREADGLVGVPDSKKPRLVDESMSQVSTTGSTEPHSTEDAVMATQSDSNMEKGKSKVLEIGTGGTFRENPYTFLSPEDPTLMTCM
jgi:hypothetical protein